MNIREITRKAAHLPRMDSVKVNTALTSSLVLLSSLTKPVIGKRTGWASIACMCGRYYVVQLRSGV